MIGKFVTVAVLASVIALGLSSASASTLSIAAPDMPTSVVESKCTYASVNVTAADKKGASNNYGQVVISSIPATCAGLPLTFLLYRSNGDIVVSGSATATAGSMTLNTSNYSGPQVEGSSVVIGTWPVQSVWSLTPPPVLPAVSCTPLTEYTGSWPPPNTYGDPTTGSCTATIHNYSEWGSPLSNFNFQVTVTGANNWELTFNFANTDVYPGFTPTNVGGSLNPYPAPTYSCGSLPVFTARKYLPHGSNTGYIEANNVNAGTGNQFCP